MRNRQTVSKCTIMATQGIYNETTRLPNWANPCFSVDVSGIDQDLIDKFCEAKTRIIAIDTLSDMNKHNALIALRDLTIQAYVKRLGIIDKDLLYEFTRK